MTGTLQRKFVLAAMTAITVLILIMLGAINLANIVLVREEIDRTLNILVRNEGSVENLGPMPGSAPPGGLFMPENEYDTVMSSNFFVVRFDRDGEIIETDISRTSAVTQEEAKELAADVYKSGGESGRIGSFRYLIRDSGPGSIAVFLDTAGESLSYIRVLLLSGAVGLVCWGLMLVFVILLSKRAIRPIAENIERQKQFVIDAGHEIKTPLAIIRTNTEAMELYQGESKWSKNIKEQTVRLDGLMKNLLMLARMDEGAGKAEEKEFSLDSLLTGMIRGFMPSMEMKEIVLKTRIQPDVILYADRGQIEQLISILLDNAVKYTNEGGEIRIVLSGKEKRVRLEVLNTCEQLPDVPADKLFDRFYRGDAARTQRNGGYGIGLSAARSIAAANRGTIHASYLKPNQICFTVRI